MIENPKVGQRGICIWDDSDFEWFTILRIAHERLLFEWDNGGQCSQLNNEQIYSSPASAAAALRAEAQRLMDAADKLESEEPNAD